MTHAARSWYCVTMTSQRTVKKRLTVYHDQTQPLIEYYKKAGILKSVDGTQDLNKVFEDIEAVLEA